MKTKLYTKYKLEDKEGHRLDAEIHEDGTITLIPLCPPNYSAGDGFIFINSDKKKAESVLKLMLEAVKIK